MGLGARDRRGAASRPEPGLETRKAGASAAARPIRHALFFALAPTPDEGRRFAQLGAELLSRSRLEAAPRPARLLHLSVLGLGAGARLSERAVARGLEIGPVVRRCRFEVVFDAALSFGAGSRLPLVLGCTPGSTAALTGLRDALGRAGEDLGFEAYDPRVYVPHLTLAYTPAPMPETVLEPPVIWRPREIVLIHSLQGLSRHVRLGRWPLLD